MPTYKVKMLVEFEGEIEADSESEAERLAIYDQTCHYSGVYEITTEEQEDYAEDDEELPAGEYGGGEDSMDW